MTRLTGPIALVLLLAAGCVQLASAGERQSSQALRIYIDCDLCDHDYLRQNVGFVEYVRDRNAADIHLLVLTETTGGGGRVWTLMFIGYDRFRGQTRTLEFATTAGASGDEQRSEFARVFRIGLVAYGKGMDWLDEVDVTLRERQQSEGDIAVRPAVAGDGWNHWVFRIDAGGDLSGEVRSRIESYQYAVSASRVTDQWKFKLSGHRQNDRSRFEFEGEDAFESERASWQAEALLVRSLGAHWAIGSEVAVGQSSFTNIDRSASVRAGIEFDIFPYRESSRRSLTTRYLAGADRNEYREVTIFDQIEETVAVHQMDVSAGFRQPWGALTARATFVQQLAHLDRYRATIWGSTDVQVFNGFSLVLFGEYSRIRDQISLPKANATREEVLLRLQELGTNYSYLIGVGVSYSFGSIFNSVVNPRFGR